MKIGLSLSRCVLDIVEGRVDINDVLVVIAGTNFDPNDDDQWSGIWHGYRDDLMATCHYEWANHPDDAEDKFRAVVMMLHTDGKLHQPRKFGAHSLSRSEAWLETVLPSKELELNPMAKKAWETFQTIAGLSNIKLK